MIKAIIKWLDRIEDEAKTREYENGFGYAATQILHHNTEPEDSDLDVTIFDQGIKDAVRAIADLQSYQKKVERTEKENADLREIVSKLRLDLEQLLHQIPAQALTREQPGTPPFKLDDLPEWTVQPFKLDNLPELTKQPFKLDDLPELTKQPFKLDDLPEWTTWVAQDASGFWYAFEKEPNPVERSRGLFVNSEGSRYEYMYRGNPNPNWCETKQRVRDEPEVAAEEELPFDVDELPEWANWAAQDADGRWYAYEKKPIDDEDTDAWQENSADGDVDQVLDAAPNPNWKSTLRRLTK